MTEQVSPLYFGRLDRLWDDLQRREPAAAAQTPPGGLLKAAVVFIDMSGFSALTSKYRSMPHVSAFIAHHFLALTESWSATARETIRGVYLDKVVGDEIMLVIPGDRVRAVGAGLRILRQAMLGQRLYPSKGSIHWGEVWLGDIGLKASNNRKEDFRSITVMGDTVNTAARLIKLASSERLETVVLEPTLLEVPIPSGFKVSKDVVDSGQLKGIFTTPQKVRIQRVFMTSEICRLDIGELLNDVAKTSPPSLDP